MNQIKSNLYSRQIGAIGKETMKTISNLTVYIIGLDSVGFETAKCLVLMGIKKLYIYDPRKIVTRIKGTNFALSNHIIDKSQNKRVDTTCISYFQQLNNYVDVQVLNFTVQNLKKSNIDVLIQTKLTKIIGTNPIKMNDLCRSNGIKYILCSVMGYVGYIFSDFGTSHTIHDWNGEKYKSCFVKNIEHTTTQTLLYLDNVGNDEQFCQGDYFKFSENSGMEGTYQAEKVNKIDENCQVLIINGILNLSSNTKLHIYEVKPDQIMSFKTLKTVLDEGPTYPNVTINETNHQKCINVIEDIHSIIKKPILIDKTDHLFKGLPINTRFEFPIVGSMVGAIVASEMLKLGGKYTPLHQECLINYSELYDEKELYKSKTITKHLDLHKLLPKKMIQYLKKMNVFVVGCGALGCEYLKLLSMLGACVKMKQLNMDKKYGHVYVTDMDHIELSNLNRQFLFQSDDIGKPKSDTACQKIEQHDSNIKLQSFTQKVGNETENVFDRSFWEKQNIIINALDNIEARQYVDNQCVIYEKPLFESGTLGTKCNVQTIIPHVTKTYSETNDPVGKSIPVCTIKNFPFKIEHCIEWALECFTLYFNDFIRDVEAYCQGPQHFQNYLQKIDNENIRNEKLDQLLLFRPVLESCTSETVQQFAREIYEICFVNKIKQILYNFPLNHTHENGKSFWTGNKLPPKIMEFKTNRFAVDFIKSFSVLLMGCLGQNSIHFSNKLCHLTSTNIFTPKKNMQIKVTDEEEDEVGKTVSHNQVDLSTQIKQKINILNSLKIDVNLKKFSVETFEKDEDENGHVEFINIISNIRAETYGIKTIDSLTCKLVAGKIVPALSTTTVLVTSLTMMEILKYILKQGYGYDKMEYRDFYVNTGINLYLGSQSQRVKKLVTGHISPMYGCEVRTIPDSFTIWDKIKLSGKYLNIVDINDLIGYMSNAYDIEVDMVSYNEFFVYSKYSFTQRNYTMQDVYDKFHLPYNKFIELSIVAMDKTSNFPIVTPKVIYCLDTFEST